MRTRLERPDLYTTGWIAALPIERAAATALLDDRHDAPEGFDQHQSDGNSYTWGRIGDHNIVIASLPAGVYGTTSAATTASNLINSLPHIRIGLLVGIGGGIAQPNRGRDIRLGDIVVSQPDGTTGGVVQYDLGKAKLNHTWERKGSLDQPPPVLLNALANLQAEHEIESSKVPDLLQAMWKANPRMRDPKRNYTHQGSENDRLFKSGYDHVSDNTCDKCDPSQEVERDQRDTTDPEIHYGVIASGNTLIKDAAARDSILEVVGEQCMCVELEAAGLMNHFPCLVIRGICDYADSHKNDRWQRYASATAAAFAAELLGFVPTRQLEATRRAIDIVRSLGEILKNEVHDLHTTFHGLDQKMVLDRLPVAAGASFDSRDEEHNSTCLQDTRVDLLRQIQEWASNPHTKALFWLNGMAGTGKSTISRTICRQFVQSSRLGSSFFFKRGEADRGSLSRFFTTIAAQLAEMHPVIAPHIKSAIDGDPNISRKATREQFDKLIKQPLGHISLDTRRMSSLVFVIDALDECDRDEDAKLIINLFSCYTKDLHPKLKVLITSRPELPIRLGFNTVKGTYQDLILHEIPPDIIEHDIATFLGHELIRIKTEYNSSMPADRQLPSDWPGKQNIQILVRMAIPLFIFAATTCRFLADRRCGNPNKQLREVLDFQTESQASQLDATYLPILNRLINGLSAKRQNEVIERFRGIVGPIVILASPLSTVALGEILGVPKYEIDDQLDLLHSVLSIPSSDQLPVRLLHLSFRDFLVDPEKQGKNSFWVDEEDTHKKMAAHCLHIMDKHLHTDICQLVKPGTSRLSINAEKIQSHMPSELQYACLYWVYHMQQAEMAISDDSEVYGFLLNHFLHWLEALSLIGRASESLSIIKVLQSVLKPEGSKELGYFLQDALRLIQANLSTIDATPLQIYSSILAFTPKNSPVRQVFQDQIPKWISLAPEPEDDWDQCQQILEGHKRSVQSVAFSPDGTLMATASDDRTVRLWRSNDGACMQELKGHEDSVTSVAFSPDGTLVASASLDRIVRLWRSNDGACVRELKGHEDSVRSVAFSPDGMLVASASVDRMVRLWRSNDGTCMQELKGHEDSVNSVAFSPDGTLVASASRDRTVRLWRSNDGACVQELKGHKDWVNSVAFSPDGTLVASASVDGTARLWRSNDGACVRELKGHEDWVQSVAFSPDGTLVASASRDRTVRLWRSNGGCVQELKGHEDWVQSVAFSPDGMLVASASLDRTVRLWRSNDGACVQELKGHEDSVLLVAFSPDGTLVASASYDGTARLWRSNDGACMQELKGHEDSVQSVAFSPDGMLVASASHDRTVRLWRSNDGACMQELKGHEDRVWSVAFSPDGMLVASASGDQTVRLWRSNDGACMRELKGHKDSVNSVAFSPDGMLVASASVDRIVRLWRSNDGACVQEIQDTSTSHLEFDFSGSYLLTDSGPITLHDPSSSSQMATKPFSECLDNIGISRDSCWILWQGTPIFWLPVPFRGSCSIVRRSTVVLGCTSGRVIIMTFENLGLNLGF
ncbi:putative wd40 protein [Thelonectria olida]|uniref:Wd40 protein n=1 Tax=Thelonectria olida TaxID=1576542 RepID=A0A9P8VXZ0_9HYPO|nr:putative wd40 protein [Thelonectria olida]